MLLRQITGTQVLLAFRASEVSSIDNECLNVSSEIEETLANIKPDDFTRQWGTPGSQWVKQRDERYKLDANEQLIGAASASGVAKGIKKRSRIYGEEHTVMFYLIILAFVDLSEMEESCLFFDAFVIAQIELFSIECRKTKTKVITLANQKGRRQSCKSIKTRSNYT